MFELVDAGFGGEQGVEVAGDARPRFAEFLLRPDAGKRAEQGFDQGLVGFDAVSLLMLQLVAQGHEFIDFGDDAVLFREGGTGTKIVFRLPVEILNLVAPLPNSST